MLIQPNTSALLPVLDAEHVPYPHRLISSKMPAWMRASGADEHQHMRAAIATPTPWFEEACHAQPQVARALAKDYAAYRAAQSNVQALLAPLPPLQAFASQQLTQAINDRFKLDLDVSRTYLFNASKAAEYQSSLLGDPVVNAQKAFKFATQSLLHCALQNFEAAQAEPGGLDTDTLKSMVLDSNQFQGLLPTGQRIDISPDAFAALCRELDIGGKYQALIDTVYQPTTPTPGNDDTATTAQVWKIFCEAEQPALLLELHKAFLSKALQRPLYQALLQLVSEGQADYLDSPLRCASINLFGAPLTGAMLIGVVASPELLLTYDPLYTPYKGIYVTYLPGAPIPLKQHGTVHDVQTYLREQLWEMDIKLLAQRVPAGDRAGFIEKLRDCLQPIDPNTVTPTPGHPGAQAQRVRDPDAWVALTLQPFTHGLLEQLATQKQQRLKGDALFHAVSTAMEDQKTADKRLAYFTHLTLTALNIGAFFVPGLGQLMLGLTVAQLGYEVFEGLESWVEGDRDQALAYLLDVIENVAFATALAAAGGGNETPAKQWVPVETPSYIEELEHVTLSNGDKRLWRPDLTPFAHDIVLPADLRPDEFGVYHHNGKTWVALDGQTYSLSKTSDSNQYRIEHPSKPESYQPSIRHNGAGAWLHEADRPRTWEGMTLFRRLGHTSGLFDEQTAQRILSVSDTHEDVLRRVTSENQPLPALLQDTLSRFKLDQDISASLMQGTPSELSAEFQRRYISLPASHAPQAPIIHRVYPDLPTVITDELLRNTSPHEHQTLAEGKIPRRLGNEIRLYQQQVRLTRAYEALYLHTVQNADTDLLIMAAAPHVDGWPTDTRVEFHEGKFKPGLLDGIGPKDAPVQRIITRYPSGYVVSKPFPSGVTLPTHETLYGALHEVMNTPSIASPEVLQGRILEAPLLSRGALRKKLGMQRAQFRSPMRLADGRLGYPLSPTPLLGDLTHLDRFTRLYLQLNNLGMSPIRCSEILSKLRMLPISNAEMDVRMAQLLDSATELQTSLNTWRSSPAQIQDPHLQAYSRDVNEIAIWTHWINVFMPEFDDAPGLLFLDNTYICEFPSELPTSITSRVSRLELDTVEIDHAPNGLLTPATVASQLGNLFHHFPALQTLDFDRPYIATARPFEIQQHLALISEHFPLLQELRLINQNLLLSTEDIAQLAQPNALRYLDVSGNFLAPAAQAQPGVFHLRYLGMERMSLAVWPEWLNASVLRNIEYLSLRDNDLTVTPRFLRYNALSDTQSTVVSLGGNRLDDREIRNLAFGVDGLPRRFQFTLDITPANQEQLQVLFSQRMELRRILNEWVTADPATAEAKGLIAVDLSDFWEGQVRGFDYIPLHFMSLSLADFPANLPTYFNEHVEQVILEDLDASTEHLDQFLRPFTRITTLALYDNVQSLQALPAALSALPLLTELEMVNQGLVIDNDMLGTIAQLPALELLDLSRNTLSPQLSGPFQPLRRLKQLSLSHAGLEVWPDWLYDVLPTHLLELDGNRMSRLPEAILEVPIIDTETLTISLSGNTLDADILARVDTQDGAVKVHLPRDFHPR